MHLERASSGAAISFRSSFPLTCGGEGCIYPLPQQPLLLAKIYHHPDQERGRKLALMVARPLEDPMATQGHVSVAWPIDVLRDKDRRGQVVGFLMRRVSDMFPVVNFYNPLGRRQSCPLFNWYYLHQTARNLAAAFAAVHRRDSLVADVNGRNILVSQRALVTLVDTDSFQVRDPESGHTFRCPVGTAEYTPPELQGCELSEIDRNLQHDCFGLAVILFQLLMEGTHPFAGLYLGRGDAPPYEQRILVGHFPYASKNSIPYRPMPVAPPLSILHPVLQHMFVRCFEEGYRDPSARPDAPSWQSALDEAAAAMVACRVNEQHRYGKHLASCPWCERTKQLGGRDPFPSVQAVQKGLHLPARPVHPRPPKGKHPQHHRHHAPYVHTSPSPLAPRTQLPWTQHLLGRLKFPKWTRELLPGVLVVCFGFASLSTTDNRQRILYALVAACAFTAALLEIFRPRWARTHKINYTVLVLVVIAGVYVPRAIPVSFWGLAIVGFWFWRLVKGSLQWRGQAVAGYVLFAAMALFSSSLGPTPGATASPTAVREPERTTAAANPPVPVTGLRELSHATSVSAVAWSPDGKTLATASLDWTAGLWDRSTGRRLGTLEEDNGLYAVAWSPDGKTLATGCFNGSVKLWNPRSRELRTQLKQSGTSPITALAWSRDGKTLATGSWDGTIRLWRTSNWRLRTQVTGDSELTSLAWSSDGAMLSEGSVQTMLNVWVVRGGHLTLLDRFTIGSGSWVAWSPTGHALAISGFSQGIKLLEFVNEKTSLPYRTIGSTSSAKGPIAWSPDGKMLANGSDDSKVILWDVARQVPLRVLTSYTDRVEAIAWNPDGKTLAIANGNKVLLWQVELKDEHEIQMTR
jgi:Tol biopolymer transport system component